MFKFYKIPSKDIIDKLIGKKASIKFSSAFTLNDSYELKFNLEIDPLADGHEKQFLKKNVGSTIDDFKSWQKHALDHPGYPWYEEQQQRSAIAQTTALCSFSADNKSNLMWSHYTDNHIGICVEYKPELFEYLKTLKKYILCGKINYSDAPLTVNILEDNISKVEKMMFNKQSEWKYEKEYRIILLSDEETEFIKIEQKYIKAVYLGSRTSTEIESEILAFCKNTDISIFLGITMGDSYKVHFEQYKENKFFIRSFWK